MIIKFDNAYLESLAKDTVKGKPKYDKQVVVKFIKTLKILQRMPDTKSLWTLHSLNFEALKGDRKGYFSVRVDYHYRLIFALDKDLLTISEVIIITELTNQYQ
jgi:toxin HigB-1